MWWFKKKKNIVVCNKCCVLLDNTYGNIQAIEVINSKQIVYYCDQHRIKSDYSLRLKMVRVEGNTMRFRSHSITGRRIGHQLQPCMIIDEDWNHVRVNSFVRH